MGYAERTVADIAARLPGATAIFRAHRIDYCCGGARPLAEAAAERAAPLGEIEAALAQLDAAAPAADAGMTGAASTDTLIDHILVRYHETHRRELPELLQLANRVERRHAEHPLVPRGLAAALHETAEALDEHMAKEEQILFPLMRRGGHPMISAPMGRMRGEHDEHGERLLDLERRAHGFALPPEACATWKALYAGLSKFVDDVREHVHLENNVLFPRF
jgi:regulator of cell morphogenesis and NO signaling